MQDISVLEETKNYVVIKVSRRLMGGDSLLKKKFTEDDALKILREGLLEHKRGKTKILNSLAELRDGD